MPKMIKCPNCNDPIIKGVAHACPQITAMIAARTPNGNLTIIAFWKLFGGIVLVLALQLGTAIWWASGIQSDLRNLKEQVQDQKQTIEKIDNYFRRPPP